MTSERKQKIRLTIHRAVLFIWFGFWAAAGIFGLMFAIAFGKSMVGASDGYVPPPDPQRDRLDLLLLILAGTPLYTGMITVFASSRKTAVRVGKIAYAISLIAIFILGVSDEPEQPWPARILRCFGIFLSMLFAMIPVHVGWLDLISTFPKTLSLNEQPKG